MNKKPFSIRSTPSWHLNSASVTDESSYIRRRQFIQELSLKGGIALSTAGLLSRDLLRAPQEVVIPGMPKPSSTASLYPAARNPLYKSIPKQRTMKEMVGATYNTFYEFSTKKEEVSKLIDGFETRPWEVEVSGLVANPGRFALDDLVRKMTLEERLYRFRCVEAWSMVIPWTGFPLARLLRLVEPKSEAGYIRFWTLARPKQMPGIEKYASWGYKFPYYEGLSINEATNDLSFMVTGVYGHELTKQHGAPIRLVVPWKYGYKSIKSVVKIEFVKERPPTFWNDLYPKEYDFNANVNPEVPHLRWSQATERVIGTSKRIVTRPYNGYGKQVAHLYAAPKPLPSPKKK